MYAYVCIHIYTYIFVRADLPWMEGDPNMLWQWTLSPADS